MSNATTPAPNPEAEAGPSTSAPAAASKSTRGLRSSYFKDFNNWQLRVLSSQLGQWETETSCVKKGCNHEDKSHCWEQAAVYQINTSQPSFYLPKIIENLPESLSKDRLQWLYTCLLAKYTRVPVGLIFSAIKHYNNCISYMHRSKRETLELDAYSLCLLYTAGRFIDKKRLLIDRLGFLQSYPSEYNLGFNWKFEEKRDRLFRRYNDGHWEEVKPGAEERAGPSAGPRDYSRELKLIYARFKGISGSEVWTEYQRTVVEAIRNMPLQPNNVDHEEPGGDYDGELDEEVSGMGQTPSLSDRAEVLSPEYIPEEQGASQFQAEHESPAPIRDNATRIPELQEEEGLNNFAQGFINAPTENTGANEEGHRSETGHEDVRSDIAEPGDSPPRIKGEDGDDEVNIHTLGVSGAVIKKEDENEKKDILNTQLMAENRLLKDEAAKMKRKYKETLKQLYQQKVQNTKLSNDSKREQERSAKRQKTLYIHVDSVYGKWDTKKMLQDESNPLADGLNPVHTSLDRLKESMEEGRAKARNIIQFYGGDGLGEEMRDWVAQDEENTGKNMEALESSLKDENFVRNADVVMELKQSHCTWVNLIKPQFEQEQSSH